MTVGELTSTVQAYYNSGPESSNNMLSDRLIYQEALALRSQLLYLKIRELNGFNISDNNFTVINCIKLIEVDAANCPCIPVKGCTIKRSEFQLPTFLATAYGEFIDYVRTIDGKVKFNSSSLSDQEDKEYREYGQLSNDYFIENKYLWIYTEKKYDYIQYVRMKAIFEDLLEVNEFMKLNSCSSSSNDEKCTAFEVEFKIDKELVKTLTDTLITNVYNYFLIKKPDTTNNATDDGNPRNKRESTGAKKGNRTEKE